MTYPIKEQILDLKERLKMAEKQGNVKAVAKHKKEINRLEELIKTK